MGTAMLKICKLTGETYDVRALIDRCSEDNYILESTVKQCHLKTFKSKSTVKVLGDVSAGNYSHRTELTLQSTDSK